MKFLVFAMLAVGLTTSTIAGGMAKEEFIDTYSKMASCVEAEYVLDKDAEKVLKERVQYYAKTNFTKAEIDQLPIIFRIRAKDAVVTAKSCEAAFKELAALPLPPQ